MERAFKGIWIPAEVWLNDELTLLEKVFLVEIDSLDNKDGCFASNDYFAKFFKLSKNRCSEVIKSLEKKGLVNISYIYKENTKLIEKRVIKVFENSNIGIRNIEEGIRNIDWGYSENCEDNNTYINNTINNKYVYKDQNKEKEFINLYKENIGVVNSLVEEQLKVWSSALEVKLFKRALEICTEKGKINFGYLKGVIKKWSDANITTLEELEAQKLKVNIKNKSNNKSISKTKEVIPKKLNPKIHNYSGSANFLKYDADELERMLLESQKGKFN